MVKIRDAHTLDGPLPADGRALLARAGGAQPVPDPERIAAALDAVLAAYGDGSETVRRERVAAALDVLETLASLGLDADALCAGVLCAPFAAGLVTEEGVAAAFGKDVSRLLAGVQRMDALSLDVPGGARRSSFASRQRQGESIRRMLVSLIDDPRVALVKLAERVQALRALGPRNDSPGAVQTAREAMDIYAPLAHRLGVGQIKWELEDLAFRHLQPADYRRIAALLDERRADRQQFIAAAVARLRAALDAAGIQAELSGRPKHLYSIWRKMQRKGIGISEVYDVRAVRVLVGSVADCYSTLGVVHGLWRNLPGEFDDYVANPKPNGYRSLHTAVLGEGGKVLEVQIRTTQMHQEAELGICAHWVYKSGGARAPAGSGYDEKIAWLRQVLGWGSELDAGELLSEHLRREVGADRVYVLTPDGHVVDLPAGATPVDFAYHVHSELGHRCRGARVDGRIVSLDHALRTGERVEIIRGKNAAPNRDWLRAGNEFVHTARARSKIRHWFRALDRDSLVASGRALLERELRRVAFPAPQLPALARGLGFASVDDLLVSLGSGETGVGQVLAHLAPEGQALPEAVPEITRQAPRKAPRGAVGVAGIDNLLTTFAGCCRPLPGDAITGYVTGGRGVSVHRADCAKLQALARSHPARIVDVAWQGAQPRKHPVDLRVVAHDRAGLLRDLVTLLGNERVNVLDLGTTVDRGRHVATVRLTIEIASLEALARMLEKLARVAGVISVRRHSE